MTNSKSQYLYQKIVELRTNDNIKQTEIASQLGISISNVEHYLSMWKRQIPVEEVRDRGRPTKLTPSVRGIIASKLDKDPFSTSKVIAQSISAADSTNVTDRTVINYLARLSYQKSLPKVVPMITDAQKVKRVEWAQSHCEFDWSKVFFSDETTIQLSANITRAWHKIGHRPNCPKSKYPLKVMF